MEEINAGQKSRTLHSRSTRISWRRQTTANRKTSAIMNCNSVALRYQRRRSRERSWKTLRGLPDGRKKRWTVFGSPALSKSWHSAIQCSQGVHVWRRRVLSPPRPPAALNGRMPTFRRRSLKHCPAFFLPSAACQQHRERSLHRSECVGCGRAQSGTTGPPQSFHSYGERLNSDCANLRVP